MSANISTSPMSPDASNASVLDPDDAQALQVHGLLTPPTSSGMIKVSKRRLREHSSSDDSSISTSSTLKSSTTQGSEAEAIQPSIDDEMVSVPVKVNSSAYLVWLGFHNDAASELFDAWLEEPTVSILLDFAKSRVRQAALDTAETYVDWPTAMDQIGINIELQSAIMTPSCDHIRLTHSLQYWLIDTFNIRHHALEDISRKSTERKKERQKRKTQGKTAQTGPSPTTHQPSRPEVSTWATAPESKPGHLLLWKGIDVARTNGLLNDAGQLLDLQAILSTPPGDFSGVSAMWYFSVSKDIAEEYARYALYRVDKQAGNVCLVALQVPDELIQQLNTHQLYYPTEEWKQTVHESRRGRALPQELSHLDDSELIIGHICKSTNRAVEGLSKWNDLTVENVMRLPNNNNFARQHVFTLRPRFKLHEACQHAVSLHRSRHSK